MSCDIQGHLTNFRFQYSSRVPGGFLEGCPASWVVLEKKSAWVPQRLCNPLGFLAILRICFTPGVCLGWAWGVLGVCLGCAWGVPGRAWGVLGVCLGCAWGVLGRAWGVLGVTGVCLGLAWGVLGVCLTCL